MINLLIKIKGDIFGGIVGTDIVRYDIYGKDVYIANKMESNSLPGRVLISEKTENIISPKMISEYSFEENKEIELPIFGEKMLSYFVLPKNIEEMY